MKAKGILLLLAGLAFVGAVALAVGAFVVLPRYVESQVKSKAAERGLELEIGSLELGWQWVKLHDTRARLTGVTAVTLHFDTVSIGLDGRDLASLDIEGLDVAAQGPLPTLAIELGAWSKRFPGAYTLPLSASGVSVNWRPEPSEPPWLSLSGATLARTPAATVVVAEKARVSGVDLGRVGAAWSATASSVALGFGETELGKAPLRVDAVQLPTPKVTVTLAPTPLETLAGPFAVVVPVKGVLGSAVVTFDFASKESMIPSTGHARFELKGYIPPHPVEIDGFVFGDTTVIETDLRIADSLRAVALESTSVTAGKFVLKGSGAVTQEADETHVKVDLTGALPCDALAGAAAESRLGRLLGRAAGTKAGIAARRVIGGSVTVRVQIDAGTKNLPGASVTRSIGIGCGLKPLTLEDLKQLGEQLFAGDLSKLPEELGKLIPPGPFPIPSGLPPIPSSLPTVFRIPSSFPSLPPRPSASAK